MVARNLTMPTREATLERQAPLVLTIPSTVTIIGCGGVGSWIAMFLALAGVPQLMLWDADTVSEHNLNRLPFGPGAVNHYKSRSLHDLINQMVPRCECLAFLQNWTSALALDIGGNRWPLDHWIVAATDTHASRVEAHQFALDHNLPYIEASAEGEYGGIAGAPAMFVTDNEAAPGYASVPVHVAPCVAAASLACWHILHDHQPSAGEVHRIGWQRESAPGLEGMDYQVPQFSR